MMWQHRHWVLAKRLGLYGVARRIHGAQGPWIIPTAAAEFALRASGMWPPEQVAEPIVSVSPYR